MDDDLIAFDKARAAHKAYERRLCEMCKGPLEDEVSPPFFWFSAAIVLSVAFGASIWFYFGG